MRIWFNRGFSLAPIARAMMARDPSLEVMISTGAGMPVYAGPSQSWVEPCLDAADYLEWTRRQIERAGIDLFVPTRHRSLFAAAAMPCRVHLPAPIDTLDLLEDKFRFASAIRDEAFRLETRLAASAAELREVLREFRAQNPTLDPCVKPRTGVIGHGFWILTRTAPLAHLMDPDGRRIHEDMFLSALEAEEKTCPLQPWVLMPYLPGPEVSIDILAHDGAVLKYVARTKKGARQRLQSAHALGGAVGSLIARFGLHGVVNIQFRRADDGTWKVLEINARPAGGSVYAEQFGARLLSDWAGLLTGRLGPEGIFRSSLDLEIEIAASPRQIVPEIVSGIAA